DQRRNLHVSVVCQRTARETSLVIRMQYDGVSGRPSRWKSNRWFQQNSGSGTYRIAPKSSFFLRKQKYGGKSRRIHEDRCYTRLNNAKALRRLFSLNQNKNENGNLPPAHFTIQNSRRNFARRSQYQGNLSS